MLAVLAKQAGRGYVPATLIHALTPAAAAQQLIAQPPPVPAIPRRACNAASGPPTADRPSCPANHTPPAIGGLIK